MSLRAVQSMSPYSFARRTRWKKTWLPIKAVRYQNFANEQKLWNAEFWVKPFFIKNALFWWACAPFEVWTHIVSHGGHDERRLGCPSKLLDIRFSANEDKQYLHKPCNHYVCERLEKRMIISSPGAKPMLKTTCCCAECFFRNPILMSGGPERRQTMFT